VTKRASVAGPAVRKNLEPLVRRRRDGLPRPDVDFPHYMIVALGDVHIAGGAK